MKTIWMNVGKMAVCGLLLLTSCNSILEDERYLFVKPPQTERAVLIEDFTGQRCINCPNAAVEIEKLKEQYGDGVIIAVGIHSGPLAVYTRGRVLGLRTEEGDAYYDYWKIEQEPIGLVNRRGAAATIDKWATLVHEAVQVPSDIYLTIESFYYSDTRKVDFLVNVVNGVDFDGHIQVWLTESNITALQMMPDGSANQEYIHNHVFRKSVNGQWGTPYKASAGDIDVLEYSCELDESWVSENMAVVVFAYNSDGVQQVIEAPLDLHPLY